MNCRQIDFPQELSVGYVTQCVIVSGPSAVLGSRSLSATMSNLLFSTIDVTRQAFYRTSLTCAIVNLKPIVPGRKS